MNFLRVLLGYNAAMYIESLKHGPPRLTCWMNNDEINTSILTVFWPPVDRADRCFKAGSFANP